MISKRRKQSFSVIAASALCGLAVAAMPALASAASLTKPNGTLVPKKTRITLVSTDATIVYAGSSSTEKCERWEFVGGVTENSGTAVRVEGLQGGSTKNCALSGVSEQITPILKSIELTPSVKQLAFDAQWSTGLYETAKTAVSYLPPATQIHIEGQLQGSRSGIFSGDFKTYGGSGELLTVN